MLNTEQDSVVTPSDRGQLHPAHMAQLPAENVHTAHAAPVRRSADTKKQAYNPLGNVDSSLTAPPFLSTMHHPYAPVMMPMDSQGTYLGAFVCQSTPS